MPVMPRPIQPLSALAVAGSLLVSNAAGQIEPVEARSITRTLGDYTTSTEVKPKPTTTKTSEREAPGEGLNATSASTPLATTSSSATSTSAQGDPLPTSGTDPISSKDKSTTDPSSTTSTTSTSTQEGSLTPTVFASKADIGRGGGTTTDQPTSDNPLGTVAPEGTFKPTDCTPDSNYDEDACRQPWVADEISAMSNPGGGSFQAEPTTSTATSIDERPTPPIETVTGTGPPEPVISKPAPTLSYRGSVTSVTQPSSTQEITTRRSASTSADPVTSTTASVHTMHTMQDKSASQSVQSGKTTVKDVPSSSVEDAAIPTPDTSSFDPLVEGVKSIDDVFTSANSSSAVFPTVRASRVPPTTKWTPVPGPGKPTIERRPYATVHPEVLSTTAEQNTTESAEKSSKYSIWPSSTPNGAPVTEDGPTSHRPAANQAAPAATTLGANSRGLFQVPFENASATATGSSKATSAPVTPSDQVSGISSTVQDRSATKSDKGLASETSITSSEVLSDEITAATTTTTEAPTGDGASRAQATTIEVTTNDGPFQDQQTPVTEPATDYGSLSTSSDPVSSTIDDLSTASSNLVTPVGPNYGGPAATTSDKPTEDTTADPISTASLEPAFEGTIATTCNKPTGGTTEGPNSTTVASQSSTESKTETMPSSRHDHRLNIPGPSSTTSSNWEATVTVTRPVGTLAQGTSTSDTAPGTPTPSETDIDIESAGSSQKSSYLTSSYDDSSINTSISAHSSTTSSKVESEPSSDTKTIPRTSKYSDPHFNTPRPSSTIGISSAITVVDVPRLSMQPTTTSDKPTDPPSSTPKTESGFTIIREQAARTGSTTTTEQTYMTPLATTNDTTINTASLSSNISAASAPEPTFPALLPIVGGWTMTAENGSVKTILPTTSETGSGTSIILSSLLPGETTSTSCVSSTVGYGGSDHSAISGNSTSEPATEIQKTVWGTLSVSTTSTNTGNKPVNMFPTVGPIAVVSRMDLGLDAVAGSGAGAALDVGVEPAALLGVYERAYGGESHNSRASSMGIDMGMGMDMGMLRFAAETALWGTFFSSLISKGGRRYARGAVLTLVSLALVLLQMKAVKAVDLGRDDLAYTAQPSFGSDWDSGAGALFGGLGGFAFVLAMLGSAGAYYIKKGVEKTRKEEGVESDTDAAQEWAKYQARKDKGMDRRKE